MNDSHGSARFSRKFRENPDLHLDERRYGYGKEAVRSFRLAQIEEVCRNYDIDGFELDFMRWPYYFRNPKAEMGLMTQLVRDVRTMMLEVGREKGRQLVLLATVPRTIAECAEIGLAVRTWVSEGLIDLLAAKNFIWFEQDLPVKEWMELVKGTDVDFYAGFEHGDTLETFRAGAAKYFRDGATGRYIYNFWSFDLPYNALGRQVLTEVASPELLEGQDKHDALLGGGPCQIGPGDPCSHTGPVPATLASQASKTFETDIADDVSEASQAGVLKDVTLRVVTETDEPDIDLALNGETVDAACLTRNGATCEVVLATPRMHAGRNRLRITSNPPDQITIASVETLIRYHDSRPPVSPPLVVRGVATGRDTRYVAKEGPWKNLKSHCPSVPLILAARGRPDEHQPVSAIVKIESPKALALARTVRVELRTPRDNMLPHEPTRDGARSTAASLGNPTPMSSRSTATWRPNGNSSRV